MSKELVVTVDLALDNNFEISTNYLYPDNDCIELILSKVDDKYYLHSDMRFAVFMNDYEDIKDIQLAENYLDMRIRQNSGLLYLDEDREIWSEIKDMSKLWISMNLIIQLVIEFTSLCYFLQTNQKDE